MIYLDVKDEGNIHGFGTSVELRGWVVTPDVGYTVLSGDRQFGSPRGARYLYLESDIRLGARGIDESSDIWDGIVGIRGRINLTEKLYLPYYLDIGTGGSEMTWQASATSSNTSMSLPGIVIWSGILTTTPFLTT